MAHCKPLTICIAEISKHASRIAIKIFPNSPKNEEKLVQNIKFLNYFRLLRNTNFQHHCSLLLFQIRKMQYLCKRD